MDFEGLSRLSAEEIEAMAEDLASNILDENVHFSERMIAYADMKAMQKIFSLATEMTKDNVNEMFRSYKKPNVEITESVSFQLINSSRYDYEQDPIYAELKQQLKERQLLLKTSSNKSEPFKTDEGELIPKVPKSEGKLSFKTVII